MRALVLTSVGALAICVTVSAFAAEENVALNLTPDASFNAKWDRCEALARQRGTPPGKLGYGDFIDECVKNIHELKAAFALGSTKAREELSNKQRKTEPLDSPSPR
jgi:hypothetical protein